jgi:hypothetical protein
MTSKRSNLSLSPLQAIENGDLEKDYTESYSRQIEKRNLISENKRDYQTEIPET